MQSAVWDDSEVLKALDQFRKISPDAPSRRDFFEDLAEKAIEYFAEPAAVVTGVHWYCHGPPRSTLAGSALVIFTYDVGADNMEEEDTVMASYADMKRRFTANLLTILGRCGKCACFYHIEQVKLLNLLRALNPGADLDAFQARLTDFDLPRIRDTIGKRNQSLKQSVGSAHLELQSLAIPIAEATFCPAFLGMPDALEVLESTGLFPQQFGLVQNISGMKTCPGALRFLFSTNPSVHELGESLMRQKDIFPELDWLYARVFKILLEHNSGVGPPDWYWLIVGVLIEKFNQSRPFQKLISKAARIFSESPSSGAGAAAALISICRSSGEYVPIEVGFDAAASVLRAQSSEPQPMEDELPKIYKSFSRLDSLRGLGELWRKQFHDKYDERDVQRFVCRLIPVMAEGDIQAAVFAILPVVADALYLLRARKANAEPVTDLQIMMREDLFSLLVHYWPKIVSRMENTADSPSRLRSLVTRLVQFAVHSSLKQQLSDLAASEANKNIATQAVPHSIFKTALKSCEILDHQSIDMQVAILIGLDYSTFLLEVNGPESSTVKKELITLLQRLQTLQFEPTRYAIQATVGLMNLFSSANVELNSSAKALLLGFLPQSPNESPKLAFTALTQSCSELLDHSWSQKPMLPNYVRFVELCKMIALRVSDAQIMRMTSNSDRTVPDDKLEFGVFLKFMGRSLEVFQRALQSWRVWNTNPPEHWKEYPVMKLYTFVTSLPSFGLVLMSWLKKVLVTALDSEGVVETREFLAIPLQHTMTASIGLLSLNDGKARAAAVEFLIKLFDVFAKYQLKPLETDLRALQNYALRNSSSSLNIEELVELLEAAGFDGQTVTFLTQKFETQQFKSKDRGMDGSLPSDRQDGNTSAALHSPFRAPSGQQLISFPSAYPKISGPSESQALSNSLVPGTSATQAPVVPNASKGGISITSSRPSGILGRQTSLSEHFKAIPRGERPEIRAPRLTTTGVTPSAPSHPSAMELIRQSIRAAEPSIGGVRKVQRVPDPIHDVIHPARPPGFNPKKREQSPSPAVGLSPATREHEQLKSSDQSSDSEHEDSEHGPLYQLGKTKKGKRNIESMPLASAGVHRVAPKTSSASSLESERRKMRMRLSVDASKLHNLILSWEYFDQSDFPKGFDRAAATVPDTFKNAEAYQSIMEPLLTLEAWQGILRAKDEAGDPFILTIGKRSNVDDFVDVHVTMPRKSFAQQKITESDIILLAYDGSKDPDTPRLPRASMPHALAKVREGTINTSMVNRELVDFQVRTFHADALLPYLVPHRGLQALRVMSILTIEREFSALQALPYYDLVDDILQANSAKPLSVSPVTLSAYEASLGLNRSQAKAVYQATNAEGFSLIQGPPGTGKTKTILGIIGAYFSDNTANKRILVCAPSNAAVDELLLRLKEGVSDVHGMPKQLRIVRLGRSDAVNLQTRDFTLEEQISKAITSTAEPVDNSLRERRQKLLAEKKENVTALETPGLDADRIMEIQDKITKLNLTLKEVQNLLQVQREGLDRAKKHRETEYKTVQKEILSNCQVVCATLSGSAYAVLASLQLSFSTVIIDEAAQSVELSALIPLRYGAKRCVMVGDPNQLPPTVLSKAASNLKYEQSLFVRMFKKDQSHVTMLNTQFRMHPDIAYFPSISFYDGKLLNGPDLVTKTARPWHSVPMFSTMKFFDVPGSQEKGAMRSLRNRREVMVAKELVGALLREFPNVDFTDKIGVISPYKQQVRDLQDAFVKEFGRGILSKVSFSSIDGFQGQEKDIVVFSCVRAETDPRTIGFLADIRRMNVGLTRARSSLWVLGNARSLELNVIWRRLISASKEKTGRFMAGTFPGTIDSRLRASSTPTDANYSEQESEKTSAGSSQSGRSSHTRDRSRSRNNSPNHARHDGISDGHRQPKEAKRPRLSNELEHSVPKMQSGDPVAKLLNASGASTEPDSVPEPIAKLKSHNNSDEREHADSAERDERGEWHHSIRPGDNGEVNEHYGRGHARQDDALEGLQNNVPVTSSISRPRSSRGNESSLATVRSRTFRGGFSSKANSQRPALAGGSAEGRAGSRTELGANATRRKTKRTRSFRSQSRGASGSGQR